MVNDKNGSTRHATDRAGERCALNINSLINALNSNLLEYDLVAFFNNNNSLHFPGHSLNSELN